MPSSRAQLPVGFLMLITGYAVSVVVVFVLFLMKCREVASLVALAAPAVWTFGLLVWVVFFDSRGRWPRASLYQRLVNVVTFRRN